MATQFPFPWLIDEAQQRVILFINHVLMQEPAARERLQRQKGSSIQLVWRDFVFQCVCTPAGLFEWVPSHESAKPDLILQVKNFLHCSPTFGGCPYQYPHIIFF